MGAIQVTVQSMEERGCEVRDECVGEVNQMGVV